ncbi:dihydroxyacetone phosphate acyltransferase isoform X2 [Diorhabda sublineata]|uniref:dihydroxyacetone phosphate acyltransferase isoform X2 n=1 Tax=Diorhabda sublineata TaxID=1163346 RepID=UPI0024E158C7|nr:dihydroxyacetone phosphate acyltransferase isoform X2 [Diorhabda sublineata]XP_056635484.1 dihydroxyacetone phosphate acyltransferase isoform X2 [Diorhabda sublineata]XP_056635485.1 dihydroxyacetone phosphate acyltransferase isoform X2 [Diorhabda sublineata]
MNSKTFYKNFLQLRREEVSNLLWISKRLDLQVAYGQGKVRPTPYSHKIAVLNSPKIQDLLMQISIRENIPKSKLEPQVLAILNEIGYDRKIKVIRWLGLLLTKICLRVLRGIYVNVEQVEQIKKSMGDCPVVFVPTHRSYGDFIMMSYLNFTYDIELPAIAAGMDFHGMWGMGTILRNTGAFFMRRSYNNDNLYWTTFRQYIHQITTKGDLPIEFFIEGTRSRSNKSLPPKYGLLTMILKAFFLSEVPDILFVPISINYDRILEESLFAFELLGVPKPKESTSGLFKSMKILKEEFGNIYIHMDAPISVRKFFGNKINRGVHNLGPLYQQELTENEKNHLPSLAYEILNRHQKVSVVTVFNLIAIILNNNLSYDKTALTIEELTEEVEWIKNIIQHLGGFIYVENLTESVREALSVHKGLIMLNEDKKLTLIKNKVNQQSFDLKRLKAHALNDDVMTHSIPFVTLQIYSNLVLHYFIELNIILISLGIKSMDGDQLFDNYQFLRSLFAKEFITVSSQDRRVFNAALENAAFFDLINVSNGYYRLGNNGKLRKFIENVFVTFYLSYEAVFVILQKLCETNEEKVILVNVQMLLEKIVLEQNVHPYSLNLDTIGNCLGSLCDLGVLKKTRRNNKILWETDMNKLYSMKTNFEKYIPRCIIPQLSYKVLRGQIPNKL